MVRQQDVGGREHMALNVTVLTFLGSSLLLHFISSTRVSTGNGGKRMVEASVLTILSQCKEHALLIG